MTTCCHMICPFCTNVTKIYNSRSTHEASQTWRRHRCTACKRAFTTREQIDWNGTITITDTNGTNSNYSRERLLLSLLRATERLEEATSSPVDLCDTIELELQKSSFFSTPAQESRIIVEHALSVLHRYDPNAALQYLTNVYAGKPPVELIKRFVVA